MYDSFYDRKKINGLSIIVSGDIQKSKYIAIFIPGFLDSKDHFHIYSLMYSLKHWYKDDYMTLSYLSFDPYGIWQSDNIYTYSFQGYIKSIDVILEYINSINPTIEIILIGHSLGGYVSCYINKILNLKARKVILLMAPENPTKTYVYKSIKEKIMNSGGYVDVENNDPFSSEIHKFKIKDIFEDYTIYDIDTYINNSPDSEYNLVFGKFDRVEVPYSIKNIYTDSKTLPVIHNYRRNFIQVAIVNSYLLDLLKNLLYNRR